jgi:hypothetical protein
VVGSLLVDSGESKDLTLDFDNGQCSEMIAVFFAHAKYHL